MFIAISAVFGFLLGAILVYVLMESRRKRAKEDAERATSILNSVDSARSKLEAEQKLFDKERAEFGVWTVSVKEVATENMTLKRDLLNSATLLRKLEVDRRAQTERQVVLDERATALAERYLKDVEKWVSAAINANNYTAQKQRLVKAIEWCREIGFTVPAEREEQLLADLKTEYEHEVRAALEREEQARIRAQIREEQAREREVQREIDTLERERAAIQAALERAMADTRESHAGEIEQLKARLAEAEAKGQRAIAQAQLTKAGFLYVISNLGSFGESVYKIGMTRRLEPLDRINELGDASVPFPFDVHMMISCEDAPALEYAIHKEFAKYRINKVNPRKEFFRVNLEEIRRFVEARHGEVKYVADAEALQYRQSISMSEEDQEYIEEVFEKADPTHGQVVED